MRNPFLKLGDPLLRKVSKEIPLSKISSQEIEKIIQKMLKIASGERKDKKKQVMVGLAAPQIRILKRIILVDIKANGKGKVGKIQVYINPEIIWKSKKKGEWYEGCFSILEVCGIVKRPESIKIEAFDINGKKVSEKHTGFTARIFQHEIDHLNGVLFISHIKNPDNLHKVLPSEFALYRDKEAWRNWPKKYPLPLA